MSQELSRLEPDDVADDDGPVAWEIEEVDRVRDHSADGEKERLAPSMHAPVPIRRYPLTDPDSGQMVAVHGGGERNRESAF